MDADLPESARFSWAVFFLLMLMLAASCATFYVLVRRWTSGRRWVALEEWARRNRFTVRSGSRTELPPPFEPIRSLNPQPTIGLTGQRTRFIETFIDLPQPQVQGRGVPRWNLLVREIESSWPTTALRPAEASESVVDLYRLEAFPTLGSAHRYLVFGADGAAARALSKSSSANLLPADIGLVLHGNHLMLDFTARPFDPIELGRMLALADQLIAHLPLAGISRQ